MHSLAQYKKNKKSKFLSLIRISLSSILGSKFIEKSSDTWGLVSAGEEDSSKGCPGQGLLL